MAYDIGTISGSVVLNDNEYNKTLKKIQNNSNSVFGKIAKYAAGILSVTAILDFGKRSIKTFSDLDEATSKFGVVFSNVMDKAEAGMDKLIKSYHFSELGAREMLSSTGDLLSGFGFGQDIALEYAQQVAELGADLASFSNYAGGAKGAAEALTKGMLGETESLKSLGIVIRQDDENFKNMVETLKTTKGLTEQQAKAEAVLKIAMQQSKNAMGDYIRTSNSLSNQMKRTGNVMQDVMSATGQLLVEAFDVGTIVNDFNDGLLNIAEYIKTHTTEWVYSFKVVFGQIVIGIEEALAYVKLFLQPIFDIFKVGFENIVGIGQWFYDNWSKIFANIGDIGKSVALDLLDAYLYIPKQIINAFAKLGKAIWEALRYGDTEKFKTYFSDIANDAIADFARLGSRTDSALHRAGVSKLNLKEVDYSIWTNAEYRNNAINNLQNKYAAKYAENEANALKYLEEKLQKQNTKTEQQAKVAEQLENKTSKDNSVIGSFSAAVVNAMLGNSVQDKIAKNTKDTVRALDNMTRKFDENFEGVVYA